MKKTLFILFTFISLHTSAEEVQFSSMYTDLSKDCKWAFKESDLKEGQDNSLSCRGYDGFNLYIDFSATDTFLVAKKSDADFVLDSEILIPNHQKGMVEWRMANKKPFAIIARSKKSEIENDKKNSTFLVIRGLKGFESLNASINATGNTRANDEARNLADNAYKTTTSKNPKLK